MANTSFRLESFRPWNPFQDTQPSRDSLDIHRYPSPVSITAASLFNSSDTASKSAQVHSYKSERHPLPARPPVEVCLNHSRPQETITSHQPDMEHHTSCINPETDAFSFEDVLQSQHLPSSGDGDHSMGLESQQLPSFESGDLELASAPFRHSQVHNDKSPVLSGECYDATIDPAILHDRHFRDVEQTPTPEVTSGVEYPSSRLSDKNTRAYGMRQNSPRTTKPGQQRSKTKVSVVDSRSSREKGRIKMSFSTFRNQFSSLPIEERLQFLSWLFEGALFQSLNTPSGANDASASKCVEREEGFSTLTPKRSSTGANVLPVNYTCSSRKRLPWSEEEDRLLVKLREEESLPWSEVIKRFDQKFPGRNRGSIQVHWSTKLRKR